jgi:fermentation-respiration switch protein FrsA (DUF1100 family)
MGKEDKKKEKSRKHSTLGLLAGCGGAAAAGGAVGAAAFFYEYSLTPKRHDPSRDADPSEKPYTEGRQWMNEHVLRKDVYITSKDGLQLHGNYIPSPDPDCRRYAICIHGYADSAESMGLYARHYYEEHGMNVLLPDLRGHGKSQGNYVGMGLDDSRDILCWISRLLDTDPEAVIILHGISMGAATVLLTTGETLPPQVKAAVSDASYTSAYEEFRTVYAGTPGAVIPAGVMMEMVRGIALLRAHYDLKKASPLEAVKLSKTPTLFIHGEEDDFVPASMMPRLFEAANCPKKFAWFAGAKHVQSVVVDPEGYWSQVDSFLESVSPWILHDNLR